MPKNSINGAYLLVADEIPTHNGRWSIGVRTAKCLFEPACMNSVLLHRDCARQPRCTSASRHKARSAVRRELAHVRCARSRISTKATEHSSICQCLIIALRLGSGNSRGLCIADGQYDKYTPSPTSGKYGSIAQCSQMWDTGDGLNIEAVG